MTMFAPSEDAVRSKAYDLWVEGGRIDGRDKDDWYRATDLLAGHEPKPAAMPRAVDIVSPVHMMAETVLSAAAMAAEAAAHVMEGLIGSVTAKVASPGPEVKPAATPSASESSEALVQAERKLQVQAGKRIRDAAIKACES